MYALVHGTTPVRPYDKNAKEFLTSHPRGAYTTARTYHRKSVFELDAHIERMATSTRLMHPGETISEVTDMGRLRPHILENLRAALHEFDAVHPDSTAEELRLTLLMAWDEQTHSIDYFCHVDELPPLPKPPVKVEIRGAPRSNALAKDSQWVRERGHLEKLKPPDVNEIILHTEDGLLLEGTQTNFYVIVDGKVQTANEGILEGTVRRLVLEVCEKHGIEVDLTPPRLDQIQRWEGAFISSTSRLALPVDWIGFPQDGKPFDPSSDPSHLFADQPLTRRIADLVRTEVAAASTPILE